MAARRSGAQGFVVWYGESELGADYVIRHTDLSSVRPAASKARMRPADQTFVENPDLIRKVLYLDRPDVIVTAGRPEEPIIGLEFSAEAPSGHDAFQRFARIVAAAENGIPFAYVLPQRKWVTRARTSRWDSYNPLLIRALF